MRSAVSLKMVCRTVIQVSNSFSVICIFHISNSGPIGAKQHHIFDRIRVCRTFKTLHTLTFTFFNDIIYKLLSIAHVFNKRSPTSLECHAPTPPNQYTSSFAITVGFLNIYRYRYIIVLCVASHSSRIYAVSKADSFFFNVRFRRNENSKASEFVKRQFGVPW